MVLFSTRNLVTSALLAFANKATRRKFGHFPSTDYCSVNGKCPNYVSSTSLDFIALKASSSERRRIILLLSLEDAFKAMKSRLIELT